ncbi:MAG TPA: hypothetical protein VIL35_03340 [Vicinamibacterales bacterium]
MISGAAQGEALAYPTGAAARDRFVLDRRGPRAPVDPWRHQGVVVEQERSAEGTIVDVATAFLTGRECPWRCVMCDLWHHTLEADTPPGAIPSQIADALSELRRREGPFPSQIKLYNAGSYFDRRAVPPSDDPAVARAVAGFDRVIVESHPALVGDRAWRLRDLLAPVALEVAMGLETAHPDALGRLNKRITPEGFRRAARELAAHGVALRVFLLIDPPFIPAAEQDDWLARSVAFAFDCGATAVSLIPTRPGEGALDALAAAGAFTPPGLARVERAARLALAAASRGRVFLDLWDFDRLARCRACADDRRARLHRMNLEQRAYPPVACAACGGAEVV